jgi:hypothetical protein
MAAKSLACQLVGVSQDWAMRGIRGADAQTASADSRDRDDDPDWADAQDVPRGISTRDGAERSTMIGAIDATGC